MDNNNLANNPNLLTIKDQNKTLDGKNWDAFSSYLEQHSWPNAKNDNDVRAFFILASEQKDSLLIRKLTSPNTSFVQQGTVITFKRDIRNTLKNRVLVPIKAGRTLSGFDADRDLEAMEYVKQEVVIQDKENQYADLDIRQALANQNNDLNHNNNIANNGINNNNVNNNNNIANNGINNNNVNNNNNIVNNGNNNNNIVNNDNNNNNIVNNDNNNNNIVNNNNNNNNIVNNVNNNNNVDNNNNNNNNINNREENVMPAKVKILDKNKKIGEFNGWDDFTNKLKQKGWNKPEDNDAIRAFYNMCDDDQAYKGVFELFKNQINQGYKEEDTLISMSNVVNAQFFDKVKRGEKVNFSYALKDSVLAMEECIKQHTGQNPNFVKYLKENTLKKKEGYQDYFNAFYGLVENNPENHPENNLENNLNNMQIHPLNNIENNVINNPENENNKEGLNNNNSNNTGNESKDETKEEEIELKRVVPDADSVAGELVDVSSGLQLGQDALKIKMFGSKAYDEAEKATNRALDTFSSMYGNGNSDIFEDKNEREQKPLEAKTLKKLMLAKGQVQYALDSNDKYLFKKDQKEDNSKAAKTRKDATRHAFNTLEEADDFLDHEIENELNNTDSAKTLAEISDSFTSTRETIRKAEVKVTGSKEFKTALKEYERLQKKWNSFKSSNSADGEEKKNINVAFADEMEDDLRLAETKIDAYLKKKFAEDKMDDVSRARVDSMLEAKGCIMEARQKLNKIKKEYMEAEPMNGADLLDDFTNSQAGINEAKLGVHLGSNEFKYAEKDFKSLCDHMNEIVNENQYGIEGADKEQYDKWIRAELLINQTAKSINNYLMKKHGKELDDKEIKRVAAMRNAMATVENCRKKLNANKEIVKSKVLDKKEANLLNNERSTYRKFAEAQFKVNGTKVYRSSDEFDNALAAYKKCVDEAATKSKNRVTGVQDSVESQTAWINKLKAAQEKLLAYSTRKEKQKQDKKKLDFKDEGRQQVMRDAYARLDERIMFEQAKLDKLKTEKEIKKENSVDRMINEVDLKIQSYTSENDLQKKVTCMTTKDYLQQLKKLSNQKKILPEDRHIVWEALLCMSIYDKIDEKRFNKNDASKSIVHFKKDKIEKQVSEIGKDTLNAIMPESAITPGLCKQMLTDVKFRKDFEKKTLAIADAVKNQKKDPKTAAADYKRSLNNSSKKTNPIKKEGTKPEGTKPEGKGKEGEIKEPMKK